MKVLIVFPNFPYPPNNGFRIKAFNLIQILRKYFEVELLILQLKEAPSDFSFFDSSNIKYKIFYIDLFSKVVNLFSALFSGEPFQTSVFKSKEAEKYLKDNMQAYNYILFSMIRTASYVKFVPKQKVIVDMIDLLSKSYSKSLQNTSSLLFKAIYRLETERLLRMEKEVSQRAKQVLLVNKEEANSLNQYNQNVTWIPNGVNEKLFTYNKVDNNYVNDVVFLGTMNYQPNVDAIDWLDKYVLDRINKNIRVLIIGKSPSKTILEIAIRRPNVIIMGFVEDPYVIVKSCLAVLAPMQNGGGIQNKLLESMALGTINIVSSFAAEPLFGAKHGEHFLVSDSPKEYSDAINAVYINRKEFQDLKDNAKNFIKQNFTWELYENEIKKIFTELN